MDMVVCPHCKAHRIVTARVPRDVIVVMPCPACHELAVVFRNKVIALDRRIIEDGSFDERKEHLAEVIAEFLEAGMLPFDASEEGESGSDMAQQLFKQLGGAEIAQDAPEDEELISEEEVERFTRIELKHLDNTSYFRRHFG